MGEPVPRHRRRERRRSRPEPPGTSGEYAAAPPAPPVEKAPPPEPVREPVRERPEKRPRRPDLERGLRGIVGAGPSQVGVSGAMRARDAARPTPEDLAAAERDLVIVRRHYVPPPDQTI